MNQPTLPEHLDLLGQLLESALFEGELKDRFAHHAAHLAAERWVQIETAFLINRYAWLGQEPGAQVAVVEHNSVDVTLLEPAAAARAALPAGAKFLELKVVDTGAWEQGWKGVHTDLRGRAGKPAASFSLCVLMHALSENLSTRRASTVERHEKWFLRVPERPALFEPVEGQAPLLALACFPCHLVDWPHPVFGRWPKGYKAKVRLVWVTRPDGALQQSTGRRQGAGSMVTCAGRG